MNKAKEFDVSGLNKYIKSMLDHDFVLNNICVSGEVSGCKYHDGGNIYFNLKDDESVIRAVIWRSTKKPDFKLTDGMSISVTGCITSYAAGGYYYLNVREAKRTGVGELYKKLEQLKIYYSEMGLFDERYKKNIPVFSRRIGVVTARTGAAIEDIIKVSKSLNPYVELILYPALVQGEGAALSIAGGIDMLDGLGLDCIIIGRGGGSIENLWAFNEEPVIEAVFRAQTPIISGVGHETDVTISDFVADKRAATPSAAAMMAVCDIRAIDDKLTGIKNDLTAFMERTILRIRTQNDGYRLRLIATSPSNDLKLKKERLTNYFSALSKYMETLLVEKRNDLRLKEKSIGMIMSAALTRERGRVSVCSGRLDALSPLKSLSRGYGYIENNEGKRINSIEDVSVDSLVKIYFTDGYADAHIKEKHDEKLGQGMCD